MRDAVNVANNNEFDFSNDMEAVHQKIAGAEFDMTWFRYEGAHFLRELHTQDIVKYGRSQILTKVWICKVE